MNKKTITKGSLCEAKGDVSVTACTGLEKLSNPKIFSGGFVA
jgi:hypothetical protein